MLFRSVAEELPAFDRPARFTVTRGARGAVKAESVEALHEALERPWTDDEVERARRDMRNANPWERNARRRGQGDDRRGRRDGRDGRGGRDGRDRNERGSGDERRGPPGRDKGTQRPGSPSGRGRRKGPGR